MQQGDIRSIRRTWAAAVRNHAVTGELFYNRLFSIAPETRALFKGDVQQQGMKLMTTMEFIVDHLDQLGKLIPEAEDLAIRHLRYGVSSDHYPAVGEALIWTLQQALGTGFTAADEAAWRRAYALLSDAMIAAAYPRRPEPSSQSRP